MPGEERETWLQLVKLTRNALLSCKGGRAATAGSCTAHPGGWGCFLGQCCHLLENECWSNLLILGEGWRGDLVQTEGKLIISRNGCSLTLCKAISRGNPSPGSSLWLPSHDPNQRQDPKQFMGARPWLSPSSEQESLCDGTPQGPPGGKKSHNPM